MAFAPRPGCPLCSIVQTASRTEAHSPRTPWFPAGSTQPEVLWRDENMTAYREKAAPVSDNKIPVTDHLHCHAYIAPPDRMGWWRRIAYSSLAWYPIDDLIAEIRESVSNNRVKSGYQNRPRAPIDMVPAAGARSGTADGTDTSEPSIAADLEDAARSPSPGAFTPHITA
ncbi:hypothetical protein C0993_012272 [Termitomyces sp. T159_Od127]|nr:hypothetical protein C0993_012272 [Termitomyces sp. T159_Od127]